MWFLQGQDAASVNVCCEVVQLLVEMDPRGELGWTNHKLLQWSALCR